jgi:hypothetical protein
VITPIKGFIKMGYLSWRPVHGAENTKELYISKTVDGPWEHYSKHPLKVADYNIPNGSKGYATMQRLLKNGWVMLPYLCG